MASASYLYFTSDALGLSRVRKLGGEVEAVNADLNASQVAIDAEHAWVTVPGRPPTIVRIGLPGPSAPAVVKRLASLPLALVMKGGQLYTDDAWAGEVFRVEARQSTVLLRVPALASYAIGEHDAVFWTSL